MDTLESTSGREGPAGAALALILDGGDGTLGNPVDLSAVGLIEDRVGLLLNRRWLLSEHVGVLSSGPVGELVVAKSVVVALSVVLLNVLVKDTEVDEALVEFLNASHVLSELGQVLHVLELSDVDGGGDSSESSGESFHLEDSNFKL